MEDLWVKTETLVERIRRKRQERHESNASISVEYLSFGTDVNIGGRLGYLGDSIDSPIGIVGGTNYKFRDTVLNENTGGTNVRLEDEDGNMFQHDLRSFELTAIVALTGTVSHPVI